MMMHGLANVIFFNCAHRMRLWGWRNSI